MALGQLGLSLYDFDSLTPAEFDEVCKSYIKKEEIRLHDAWERTRQLAAIIVQPYCKSKVTPEELMPFVWDKGDKKVEPSTPERFAALVKQLDHDGE